LDDKQVRKSLTTHFQNRKNTDMPGWKEIFLYRQDNPLLFTSLYFWIFFYIVFLLYSIVYKKKVLRNTYLFVVSLFFSLLIFTTLLDYSMGLLIYRAKSKRRKRLFVFFSLLGNLGVLAYFKYAYFFTELFNQLFHTHYQVADLLAQWTNQLTGSHFDISAIILPVGISFYTFQSLSYTLDVYRGKLEPVRNLVDFGFYVSFFPQLVAGPIVRANMFVPQLYQDYRVSRQEMGHAIFLIINGLIKKMIISDFLSINFVDRVFENPSAFTGMENLLAVYGYSAQIYCDFSGYTDIAIGVALLMGFRLPLNFNSPYKATSITDFWKRWHISLSTWLRDYLYISLGGNRKGSVRTYLNLMITMLLGGLWHGAHLRFVIWGGLHGLGLAAERLWTDLVKKPLRITRGIHALQVFLTFHFVTFLWIFFRADSLDSARVMIHRIFSIDDLALVTKVLMNYWPVITMITISFLIHWLPSRFKLWYRGSFIRFPFVVKVLLVILAVFLIIQLKSSQIQPFIYFQF
jgi:alginate O-acetyltransferase complex protein AlgI